jgi:hypothetical protein
VERVAERSFRYNDEFSTEFQEFFGGVRSAFQSVNDGFTTVPGMLERLRSGVQLLGQEPAENDTFFNALEKLGRGPPDGVSGR